MSHQLAELPLRYPSAHRPDTVHTLHDNNSISILTVQSPNRNDSTKLFSATLYERFGLSRKTDLIKLCSACASFCDHLSISTCAVYNRETAGWILSVRNENNQSFEIDLSNIRFTPTKIEGFGTSDENFQLNCVNESGRVLILRFEKDRLTSFNLFSLLDSLYEGAYHEGSKLWASSVQFLSPTKLVFSLTPRLFAADFTSLSHIKIYEWNESLVGSKWLKRRVTGLFSSVDGEEMKPVLGLAVARDYSSTNVFSLHRDGAIRLWILSSNAAMPDTVRTVQPNGGITLPSISQWNTLDGSIRLEAELYGNDQFALCLYIRTNLQLRNEMDELLLILIHGSLSDGENDAFEQLAIPENVSELTDMAFSPSNREMFCIYKGEGDNTSNNVIAKYRDDCSIEIIDYTMDYTYALDTKKLHQTSINKEKVGDRYEIENAIDLQAIQILFSPLSFKGGDDDLMRIILRACLSSIPSDLQRNHYLNNIPISSPVVRLVQWVREWASYDDQIRLEKEELGSYESYVSDHIGRWETIFENVSKELAGLYTCLKVNATRNSIYNGIILRLGALSCLVEDFLPSKSQLDNSVTFMFESKNMYHGIFNEIEQRANKVVSDGSLVDGPDEIIRALMAEEIDNFASVALNSDHSSMEDLFEMSHSLQYATPSTEESFHSTMADVSSGISYESLEGAIYGVNLIISVSRKMSLSRCLYFMVLQRDGHQVEYALCNSIRSYLHFASLEYICKMSLKNSWSIKSFVSEVCDAITSDGFNGQIDQYLAARASILDSNLLLEHVGPSLGKRLLAPAIGYVDLSKSNLNVLFEREKIAELLIAEASELSNIGKISLGLKCRSSASNILMSLGKFSTLCDVTNFDAMEKYLFCRQKSVDENALKKCFDEYLLEALFYFLFGQGDYHNSPSLDELSKLDIVRNIIKMNATSESLTSAEKLLELLNKIESDVQTQCESSLEGLFRCLLDFCLWHRSLTQVGKGCSEFNDFEVGLHFAEAAVSSIKNLPPSITSTIATAVSIFDDYFQFAMDSGNWTNALNLCQTYPIVESRLDMFRHMITEICRRGSLAALLCLPLDVSHKFGAMSVDLFIEAIDTLESLASDESERDRFNALLYLQCLMSAKYEFRNICTSTEKILSKRQHLKESYYLAIANNFNSEALLSRPSQFKQACRKRRMIALSSDLFNVDGEVHFVDRGVSELVKAMVDHGYYKFALTLVNTVYHKAPSNVSQFVSNLLTEHFVKPLVDLKKKSSEIGVSSVVLLPSALTLFYNSKTLLPTMISTNMGHSGVGKISPGLLMNSLKEFTLGLSAFDNSIAIDVARALLDKDLIHGCKLPRWLFEHLSGDNASFLPSASGSDPKRLLRLLIEKQLFVDAMALITTVLNTYSKEKSFSRLPEKGDIDFIPTDDINILWKLVNICIRRFKNKKKVELLVLKQEEMKMAIEHYHTCLELSEKGLKSARAVKGLF